MTENERWIVYPLLLVCFLFQIKDKIVGQFRVPRVTCGQLVLEGPDGKTYAELHIVKDRGGRLLLHDTQGQIAVEASAIEERGGTVSVYEPGGKVTARVTSDVDGAGAIATFHDDKILTLLSASRITQTNELLGGAIDIRNTEGQLSASLGQTENRAGSLRMFAADQPLFLLDEFEGAGRLTLLSKGSDPVKDVKVLLHKAPNNWGAGYFFSPEGLPNPIAHFSLQRVMPPGVAPPPVDPNTPLPHPQHAPATPDAPQTDSPQSDGTPPPPSNEQPSATPANNEAAPPSEPPATTP